MKESILKMKLCYQVAHTSFETIFHIYDYILLKDNTLRYSSLDLKKYGRIWLNSLRSLFHENKEETAQNVYTKKISYIMGEKFLLGQR